VKGDHYRALIYALIIGVLGWLVAIGRVESREAVPLFSAIAGYVVGRVVNGTSSPI
jgi:uncharacterized membrane protein YjjB (DUF3815 family)